MCVTPKSFALVILWTVSNAEDSRIKWFTNTKSWFNMRLQGQVKAFLCKILSSLKEQFCLFTTSFLLLKFQLSFLTEETLEKTLLWMHNMYSVDIWLWPQPHKDAPSVDSEPTGGCWSGSEAFEMPHEQHASKKSEWCADTLKDVLNMQCIVTPIVSNLSAWSVALWF